MVRVKLRLARWSGVFPAVFPAGPEEGDLEAFGSRALDAVGVRLAGQGTSVMLRVPLAGVPS
jgi:hypothetical protein